MPAGGHFGRIVARTRGREGRGEAISSLVLWRRSSLRSPGSRFSEASGRLRRLEASENLTTPPEAVPGLLYLMRSLARPGGNEPTTLRGSAGGSGKGTAQVSSSVWPASTPIPRRMRRQPHSVSIDIDSAGPS